MQRAGRREGRPARGSSTRAGRRGGLDGEVRTRGHSEQAEEPPFGRCQPSVGEVERHPDRGVLVAVDLQRGQPVPGAQLGHLARDAPVRLAGQVRRGDPQRQRQARASARQVGRGLGLRTNPLRADDVAAQPLGLVGRQRVERQPAGALAGDQSGEPVPAGDHDQTTGAAGQQRAHLPGRFGVVEHEQQPPARRGRPVQPGCLVEVGGDLVDAERVQELPQPLGRLQRRRRGVAAQVEMELAVGEPAGDPVGPVDRQGGLAHPGRPGDHHDRHGGGVRVVVGQQRVEPAQLVVAADEPGDVSGQLRRDRRRGVGAGRRHRAGRVQRRVGEEHGLLEPLQLHAGLDAEPVDQPRAKRPVGRQGVGLAARAV